MAVRTLIRMLSAFCAAFLMLGGSPALGQPAPGSTPGVDDMAGSVVSRLVAWRARTDQPVALGSLTAFEWDSFSVERVPAGVAMANCGRDGFVPCDKGLQPAPDGLVQVLRFDRAGQAVYQERIIVGSASFAEPLPAAVPRGRATLVTCADGTGRRLWCVQSGPRPALPGLDGA